MVQTQDNIENNANVRFVCCPKIDINAILEIERRFGDSPFQNLAQYYADMELNTETLAEVFMIAMAEKIYMNNLFSKMSDDEKRYYREARTNDKTLNVEGIHVKQTYKNYAELCRFLDEKDNLTGKQRYYQEEFFRRFFNWKKTGKGNQIMITQKYSVPKPPKMKNRDKAVYMKYVEYLILAYLYQCKDNKAEMTITDMMVTFGFVKENFRQLKKNVYRKEDMDIHDKAIKDFVQELQNLCYQIIYRTLVSLDDRRLLTWEEVTIIDNRVAEIQDKEKIRHAEFRLFDKFGIESISQLWMLPAEKQRRFYSERNEYLNANYGWGYIYNKYQLISNHNDILYGINSIYHEMQKGLRDIMYDRMKLEQKKKEKQYEYEIETQTMLFAEGDAAPMDKETKCAVFDVMSDTKSKDMEEYISTFSECIDKCIK